MGGGVIGVEFASVWKSFGADVTIMEEGTELIDRIQNNGVFPMITSCSGICAAIPSILFLRMSVIA